MTRSSSVMSGCRFGAAGHRRHSSKESGTWRLPGMAPCSAICLWDRVSTRRAPSWIAAYACRRKSRGAGTPGLLRAGRARSFAGSQCEASTRRGGLQAPFLRLSQGPMRSWGMHPGRRSGLSVSLGSRRRRGLVPVRQRGPARWRRMPGQARLAPACRSGRGCEGERGGCADACLSSAPSRPAPAAKGRSASGTLRATRSVRRLLSVPPSGLPSSSNTTSMIGRCMGRICPRM